MLSEDKATRKDREFRNFLVDSGSADSLLKLLLSLREHEAYGGDKFPLKREEKTQVHQVLLDFYDAAPDPVWDEIHDLRGSIGKLRKTCEDLESRVSATEAKSEKWKAKAYATRAWKRLSQGAEGGVACKDLLQRVFGAYKKVPHACLGEVEKMPDIEKKGFITIASTDERLTNFIADCIRDMKPPAPPPDEGEPPEQPEEIGPVYSEPEDDIYLMVAEVFGVLSTVG
ncbi:unnamed protein product [Amoebophrya sp. A25]|nr:unnamed protein product [Amoebophrya sp. A25]|eukprot:GSA25T00015423001.1